MKAHKKPTRRQMLLIKQNRLNPDNWMVERDTSVEMVLVGLMGKKSRKVIRK